MFACSPFMHWLVCLKHKYGRGIQQSLPTHFLPTGMAGIDLVWVASVCKRLDCLYWATHAQAFTVPDPAWCLEMACLQCSCFTILEYFSCRFRSMVYTVVKRQTFTVGGHFPPLLNTSSFFLFVLTCILSSSSASLRISSAPSGGSVASDAAGRGQPFISVTGGNLQTTLRQEGHLTWQPHF